MSYTELINNRNISNLTVTVNKRLKKSWKLQKKFSTYTLYIPQILENQSDEIKNILIDWAQIFIKSNFKRKYDTNTAKKVKQIEQKISTIIVGKSNNSDTEIQERHRIYTYPQKRFANAIGIKFDLYKEFNKINAKYFNNKLQSYIRWGSPKSKTSYHTIFLDERGNQHHLITISDFYNQKEIPLYALDSVLYHEMLHIALPPIKLGKKRAVHHREFKIAEKQFEYYEKWQHWLNNDAQKILRKRRHV